MDDPIESPGARDPKRKIKDGSETSPELEDGIEA